MSARMTSFWFRVSESILLVLAFLLPLAFFLRTYDGTAIKTTLFELGTLVLAFSWLFKGLERGRWELPSAARPLALPALALLAWLAARFGMSTHKLAELPAFLRNALCVATYLIALLEFGGAQNARRLLAFLTGAAWLAGLYAVAQKLGVDPLSWKGAYGARVFSTLGSPEVFGSFLALCAPLALTQWLDPERDWFLRWTDVALLLLIEAAVVWTRSPEALAALALMSLCAALVMPVFFPSNESYKAAGLALAVGVSGLAAGRESLAALRPSLPLELGWPGALIAAWLFAAVGLAAWRARRHFVKEGALSESCCMAGLAASALGWAACLPLGLSAGSLLPGWLVWPLSGMLGGMSLLAGRSRSISVLPLPLSDATRQRLYAPALLAFAGLAFFPAQWLNSEVEHNAAIACGNKRDWNGAIAHFQRVAPGAESYIDAQFFKGAAYLESGRPQEALTAFAAVETLAPDRSGFPRLEHFQARAYLALAEDAKHNGDYAAAEDAAQKAIALEPGEPAHRVALSEIFLKEKKIAESRKQQTEAAKLQKEQKKKPQG
jgi:tetratricopeptide (TPR) repeat protein